VKCGEQASEIFQGEPDIKGILVGGSGPTKQYFIEEGYLHYEVQEKIIDTFDTGYTDEFGLRELVDAASETLTDLRISQEKKLMKRFLREITKTEKSLAVYGEKQVRKALEMGAVDTLLLAENLRKYRVTLKCTTCDYEEERTITEEKEDEFELPECTKCETPTTMEIVNKIDLIDEFSALAENTGATIELISQGSEEGDSLYKAFSGIAGILRFPIEL
jgi:peptide chain release factor subunit 1